METVVQVSLVLFALGLAFIGRAFPYERTKRRIRREAELTCARNHSSYYCGTWECIALGPKDRGGEDQFVVLSRHGGEERIRLLDILGTIQVGNMVDVRPNFSEVGSSMDCVRSPLKCLVPNKTVMRIVPP